MLDFRGVPGFPDADLIFGRQRDAAQEVDPAQQSVHGLGAEEEGPLLRRHETILQRVGHLHGGVQPDDARRAFDRVGRPHERFEGLRGSRIALHGEQALRENGGLVFSLLVEKLDER